MGTEGKKYTTEQKAIIRAKKVALYGSEEAYIAALSAAGKQSHNRNGGYAGLKKSMTAEAFSELQRQNALKRYGKKPKE